MNRPDPEDHSEHFICSDCGARHDISFAYGPAAPIGYYLLPEQERESRCELTRDVCLIDDQFYIVGNLELPIHHRDHAFSWDVWVSLSLESMKRMQQLWDSEERVNEPPYFGWLSSSLPGYPATVGLKTHVHTRQVGRRPFIELEETDHPLSIEQRTGITMERVREIAVIVAHHGRGDA